MISQNSPIDIKFDFATVSTQQLPVKFKEWACFFLAWIVYMSFENESRGFFGYFSQVFLL